MRVPATWVLGRSQYSQHCCCHVTFKFRIPQLLFYSNAFLRYVPVKDLLEIYTKLHGEAVITENAIVHCSYLQFLEM